MNKNPFSFQIDPSMFEPADAEEKKELIVSRKSFSFWQDVWRRLKKNPTGMAGLVLIILLMFFAFAGPLFIPYKYDEQVRGHETLTHAPQERAKEKEARPKVKTEAHNLLMISPLLLNC